MDPPLLTSARLDLSASMVNESGAVKFLHIVAVPWQNPTENVNVQFEIWWFLRIPVID